MNWIQSLYTTYENCQNMLGVIEEDEEGKEQVPLLPICHTTQKAQIEITLDARGNFRRARVVGKNEARTIIPCTEKSAGRTSGEAAHPLCDKLQYLAADYKNYGGEKDHYFESYMELLSDWVKSGAPAKVRSIYEYVQKGNVISDLATNRVLFANEQGKLYTQRPFEKGKNAETDIFDLLPGRINKQTGKLESWQADAFVRWRVEGGDAIAEVWDDPEVIQSWIDYYSATKQSKSLCYVTGRESFTADQHPAKIRNDGDKAKLISSNDQSNFTYRGRFINPYECVTVGFDTTQKAHSALRWLMNRQGYVKGDLGVVAWAVSGAKVPQPTQDTYEAFYSGLATEEDHLADTAQEVGVSLKKKIAGYRTEIQEREDVVVMAVDSATPGRLSIVYYRALKGSEFLERIENWHETCAWRHTYHLVERQDEKGKTRKYSVPFIGAPAPADIAEAAYGSRLDDKLKKATIKRLLPCIVDGQPIPRDLVESVIRRASNRAGLSGYDWSKALTIACALYRKYKYGKENFDMSLDETRNTRDYLFGRLLAIADVMEERTLSEAEKKRPTNATRYMQQFSQRPSSTWKQIHELLTPYFMRQGDKASYYKRLIEQVKDLFVSPEEFTSNKPLTGEYLLGYYCQRQKMWEKKEKPASEENDNTNSNE
ncbi:MAG: type I-C CRISPR-associated protein Cas8c/Csd1 [Chloroflexi bacterium]|nr:type I-C CRISPR-associated protein Cas8c/Csd1 [Chloroflexota bacterium]MDL1941596.1 type I-C CRISPR-associated protein Cas8c/Csd1 [Chloroflexi bacterium CFX2]